MKVSRNPPIWESEVALQAGVARLGPQKEANRQRDAQVGPASSHGQDHLHSSGPTVFLELKSPGGVRGESGDGCPGHAPLQMLPCQILWAPNSLEFFPYYYSKQLSLSAQLSVGVVESPVGRISEIRGKSEFLLACSTHQFPRSHWRIGRSPSAW